MAVRVDPRADRSHTAALEAARGILLEEGWDALTHARLAERSGLHRATIYRHWPTPTALLHDVLAREVATTRIRPTGNLRSDLIKALTAIQREITDRDLSRVMTALIDRGEWDTELHRIKVGLTRASVGVICQVLETGKERGELAARLDPDAGVSLLVGPLLYRRLLSGEPLTPPFIRSIVDSFLAGNRSGGSTRSREA